VAKVPNGEEKFPKNFKRLSRVHEHYRRQTADRQTDKLQTTDGKAIAYSDSIKTNV